MLCQHGGGNVLALMACKSRQWTARREREGGGGGRSDEAVAMLPRGGRAADNTTRGGGGGREGGVRRAGGGRLDERGGAASGWRTTGRHNKRVGLGAHDVVGDGNGGGDSGGGSWSSEIGGVPSSMPGMASPATEPAPRGVDDADEAPMAVGGDRGGEERRQRRQSSR
jgi:hypothetical protein